MADEPAQQDPVETLNGKLLADEDLLEQFRHQPHDVVQKHGIKLTKQQHKKLADHDLPKISLDEVRAKLQRHGLRAML